MKRRVIYIVLGTLLALAGGLAVYKYDGRPKLVIGNSSFRYDLADTEAEREKGLSRRESLNQHEAMLFEFETDGPQCMWMKDMRFSLDIVWLDTSKTVVSIKENISPDTYPQSFCANKPARYVVELNAGAVGRLGLQVGQTVNF